VNNNHPDFVTTEMIVAAAARREGESLLEDFGILITRYGLAVTLFLIGILKFTAGEAQGIESLVANSPLLFWLYRSLSLQAVSDLIGSIEVSIAILIALRPWSTKLSFYGSVGAVVTFLVTLSFLLSTPGTIDFSHHIPLLGDAGQFLIKDVVLLGASLWTAAEAKHGSMREIPESGQN
jgi:reactive chlorine resistance protein C